MKVNISDILGGKHRREAYSVDFALDPGYLDQFDIVEISNVGGNAEVWSDVKDEISLKINYNVTLTLSCSRCLIPVEKSIENSLEKVIYLKKSGEEFEEDREFLSGSILDIGSMIAEDVIVNMPFQILCGEDCRGICPKCGTDLNMGSCDCTFEDIDPRLLELKKFFT